MSAPKTATAQSNAYRDQKNIAAHFPNVQRDGHVLQDQRIPCHQQQKCSSQIFALEQIEYGAAGLIRRHEQRFLVVWRQNSLVPACGRLNDPLQFIDTTFGQ